MTMTCVNEGCNKFRHRTYGERYRAVCYHCHRSYRGLHDYKPGVKPLIKDYCENKDGRLGFKCTSTIMDPCQIDMDHKDGNNFNNHIDNIQCLCSNCHRYKTKWLK